MRQLSNDVLVRLQRMTNVLVSTSTSNGVASSTTTSVGDSGIAELRRLNPGNRVLATQSTCYTLTETFVRPLRTGNSIGAAGSFPGRGLLRSVDTTSDFATSSSFGQRSPGVDGLAGVQFQAGGQTHYRSIRRRIESGSLFGTRAVLPLELTLRDWAYESFPNIPMQAGAIREAASFRLGCLALGSAGAAAKDGCYLMGAHDRQRVTVGLALTRSGGQLCRRSVVHLASPPSGCLNLPRTERQNAARESDRRSDPCATNRHVRRAGAPTLQSADARLATGLATC
ncbi:MAG: hypothetical protein AAF961_08175 [Planctomycetota bacterium]